MGGADSVSWLSAFITNPTSELLSWWLGWLELLFMFQIDSCSAIRKVAWPPAQYLFAEKYFSVSFIHVFLVGGQLFLVFSICTLPVFMPASTQCMPALFRTNVCFCPKIYKQHDKNIYIFPWPEKQFYPIMETHSGGISIYHHHSPDPLLYQSQEKRQKNIDMAWLKNCTNTSAKDNTLRMFDYFIEAEKPLWCSFFIPSFIKHKASSFLRTGLQFICRQWSVLPSFRLN